MDNQSETMKAAFIRQYGDFEVIEVGSLPKPTLQADEVLIKIHAASVNPTDVLRQRGYMQNTMPGKPPIILGRDFSGVVAGVGSDATRFQVGEPVYGMTGLNVRKPNQKGSYAEYIAMSEREIARKPANLSHEEAASLPLVGLTAWQGMARRGTLRSEQKVLIHGGSGGVGSFAIQLAKSLNNEVAATCSTRNVDMLKHLGADTVIDYTCQKFTEFAHDYDLVLDTVGEALSPGIRKDSLSMLKRGGAYVSVAVPFPWDPQWHVPRYLLNLATNLAITGIQARLGYGVHFGLVMVVPNGAQLAQITELVEQGRICPTIDAVYPLDQVREAHQRCATHHVRGKIVLHLA